VERAVSTPWSTPDPINEWDPHHVLPPAVGDDRLYPSLTEWVTRWLVRSYRRSVKTQHRLWCPDVWEHPEAVLRLQAMWDTWEQGGATSEWWLAADLHMDRLLDPAGPFAGCTWQAHHRGALPPLPLRPPHEGWEPPQIPGADPAPG
jgi:hypothetical protein